MPETLSRRSSIPNGSEIKRLRLQQHMSQKAFASKADIHLRTLQRAERGEAILPHFIPKIATALGVPPEQIVVKPTIGQKSTAQGRAEPGLSSATIQLHRQAGEYLIGCLQNNVLGPPKVQYLFKLDPYSETADLIADLIQFCDEHRCGTDAAKLRPAEEIRAIGALNDKIKMLSSHDVSVFAAAHIYFDQEQFDLAYDEARSNFSKFWAPVMRTGLILGFAPPSELKIDHQTHWTKDLVYERCGRANVVANIDPDELEEAFEFYRHPFYPIDFKFLSFYRNYWNSAPDARLASNGGKIIALRPGHGDAKTSAAKTEETKS